MSEPRYPTRIPLVQVGRKYPRYRLTEDSFQGQSWVNIEHQVSSRSKWIFVCGWEAPTARDHFVQDLLRSLEMRRADGLPLGGAG